MDFNKAFETLHNLSDGDLTNIVIKSLIESGIKVEDVITYSDCENSLEK